MCATEDQTVAQASTDCSSANPAKGNCHCAERVTDRFQLDTGGKVIVPSVSDQIIPAFLMTAMTPTAGVTGSAVILRDVSRWAHPPPLSLHAQHCLFLI